MHTCNYYPDPVAGNPRIQAAFKALAKRVREPTQVKMPATQGVVKAAMARLSNDTKHSQSDNETVQAAIQTSWIFLMRSSEFCHVDRGVHGYCLRLGDVAFYDKDKMRLFFRDTQGDLSVSIVFRGSKTDQARVGCTRKPDRTRLEIDAVEAVANMLQSRSDEWLSKPLRPLFELESGRAVFGAPAPGTGSKFQPEQIHQVSKMFLAKNKYRSSWPL